LINDAGGHPVILCGAAGAALKDISPWIGLEDVLGYQEIECDEIPPLTGIHHP